MQRPAPSVLLPLLCLPLLVAAIGSPALADPAPSVGWSSPPVVAYVVPGIPQQQRINIVIRAQRNEDRIVSLLLSAQLLPYVSALSPTAVDAPSSTDQAMTITFTASLPQNTQPGKSVAGSIDVLVTDKSNGHALERWSLPVSIRAIGKSNSGPFVAPEEEDCSNGLDDDSDGKADCQDAECAKETFCHGGSCNGFGKVDHLQVSKVSHCVSGGAFQILAFTPVGQEFTPSSPNIVAIELLLEPFNPPYTDNLSVRIREGSPTGSILGTSTTETIYHPPAFNRSDTFWQRFVFPLPVYVQPGEKYVYEVVATNASFGQHYVQTAIVDSNGTVLSYEPCDYPGGVMIEAGSPKLAMDQKFVTCATR